MELDNMFFGNSRGQYGVEHSFQYFFVARLEDLGFNSYGYYIGGRNFVFNEKEEPKLYYKDNVLMVNLITGEKIKNL